MVGTQYECQGPELSQSFHAILFWSVTELGQKQIWWDGITAVILEEGSSRERSYVIEKHEVSTSSPEHKQDAQKIWLMWKIQ